MNSLAIGSFALLAIPAFLSSALARDRVVCNRGDLIISQSEANPAEYEIVVTNAGVVTWFQEQLKGQSCSQDARGNPFCVDRAFPFQVIIVADAASKVLKVSGLSEVAGETPSFLTYPGTGARASGSGYELTLMNSVLVGSHQQITYPIGSWYFESCTNRK